MLGRVFYFALVIITALLVGLLWILPTPQSTPIAFSLPDTEHQLLIRDVGAFDTGMASMAAS